MKGIPVVLDYWTDHPTIFRLIYSSVVSWLVVLGLYEHEGSYLQLNKPVQLLMGMIAPAPLDLEPPPAMAPTSVTRLRPTVRWAGGRNEILSWQEG